MTSKTLQSRDHRIDAVRGIAIVAVVFAHVVRGLAGAGLVDPTTGLGLFNERVVYLVVLSLFVFLAGLLVAGSVEKRGAAHYLRQRVTDLVWVYLLWTLLQGAVEVATSSVKNSPKTWHDVLALWVPQGQLWFLPFLIFASILIVLIRPWLGGWRLLAGLVAGLAISVAGWGHDGQTLATRGMSLMVFIVLGAIIGAPRLVRWLDRAHRIILALVGVVLLVVALILGYYPTSIMPTSSFEAPRTVEGVALAMVGSCCGVLAVVLLTFLLCEAIPGFTRIFSLLGRESMAIYLGHIVVMAAVRIVLLRLGVTSLLIHVTAGVLIGTYACFLIVWSARWLPWLLRAPRLNQRK